MITLEFDSVAEDTSPTQTAVAETTNKEETVYVNA
jgi:hypothetical protein